MRTHHYNMDKCNKFKKKVNKKFIVRNVHKFFIFGGIFLQFNGKWSIIMSRGFILMDVEDGGKRNGRKTKDRKAAYAQSDNL